LRASTKLQVQIYKWRDELGKITKGHKAYCERKMGYHFTTRYNNLVCLECHHNWKPDKSWDICDCPSCGKKLKFIEFTGWGTDEKWFSILDVKHGYQVMRLLRTYKHVRKTGVPPCYITSEIAQIWMDNKGKTTVLRVNSGPYGSGWVHGGELEVRSNGNPYSYYGGNKNERIIGIVPHYYYPGGKVLPILKRNGFTTRGHYEAPMDLMHKLLKDNYAETLLKVKQYSLLEQHLSYYNNVTAEYRRCVRIAIRHNYIVKDARDWMDYIGFLDELGLDKYNPTVLLSKNFKADHKRYLKKVNDIETARELVISEERRIEQEKRDRLDKKFFNKRKRLLKRFELTRGNISIV